MTRSIEMYWHYQSNCLKVGIKLNNNFKQKIYKELKLFENTTNEILIV